MYSILGHTAFEDLVMEACILDLLFVLLFILISFNKYVQYRRTYGPRGPCNGGAHHMYSILGHTAFEDLVMEAHILCTVSSDTLTLRTL